MLLDGIGLSRVKRPGVAADDFDWSADRGFDQTWPMAGRGLPQDHFCPWREEAEGLRAELTEVRGDVEKMRAYSSKH
jgi:hypothetical protein